MAPNPPNEEAHRVVGIGPDEIRSAYRSRGIDRWSDAMLISAVAAVVATPRHGPADSFVLHAPLELAARTALLPHVESEARELARLHILAIAAHYETYDAGVGFDDAAPEPPAGDPYDLLATAIDTGDLDEVDRAARHIATTGDAATLAARLTDPLLPRTAAAAHAPIYLFHLRRLHPTSGYGLPLLRPLARELARQPDWAMHWFDNRPQHNGSVDSLTEALATAPLLGPPGSTFIHPLMTQVDDGPAPAQLVDALPPASNSAAKAVLRVAARSMLLDDPEHAPYGWSHCLTLPQAVLGLRASSSDPDRALAIAATQVMAFRSGLSAGPLAAFDQRDHQPSMSAAAITTAAATSHDAHVVKYTLACLDAALADPEASSLYLAAAEHLLNVWVDRGGDPTDPLA